jgi:hypothetical protein
MNIKGTLYSQRVLPLTLPMTQDSRPLSGSDMKSKDSSKMVKSTHNSTESSTQPTKMAQTNIVASHRVNRGVEMHFQSSF